MKLGIIGSGMIVHDLLSFIDKIETIELEAILARAASIEKVNQLTKQHQIKKTYFDYDTLLKDPNIDTIYVALPNHLHYEYTKKALLNHKHVICEKPFTSNLKELEELVKIAQEENCLLFEAITNQYLPAYHQIKAKLKELGNIKIVSCNFSQYSSRYDAFKQGTILPAFDLFKSGGALMDLNVYNIHFVVGLFGQPNNVTYHANIAHGIDTSGILTLEYPDFNCVCIGAKDCSAPVISTIQGDQGYIKVEGPTSILGNVAIVKNDGANEEIKSTNFRMEDEFRAMAKMIERQDFDQCSKMLKHSLMVMDVLTKARASAKIVFGCEQ